MDEPMRLAIEASEVKPSERMHPMDRLTEGVSKNDGEESPCDLPG